MRSSDDTASAFWDRVAKRYAAKPVPDEAVYEKKIEITRRHLPPEARILEVGCGTGSTALRLAPHVASIHATDISAQMISIAREKARIAGEHRICFEVAPLRAAADQESKFDAVLAHSVLHLLADWRAALHDLRSRISPGGVLIASTVCLSDHARLLRPFAGVGRALGWLPPLSFFSRAQLERALAADFEIELAWQPSPNRGIFHVARAR